jgi:hypothetical protein
MISFYFELPTRNYTSLDFTRFQHYSPRILFTIMTSPNTPQYNSEFSPEESKLSDKFASTVSLDDPVASTESSASQAMMTAQPSNMVDRSANAAPNVFSSSHTSSNTNIEDSQETSEELVKENEKLQIKFPFAFISEENIPHISVVVQNGNTITFTMNLKATSGSESDPAQPPPSVTLENLDSTILRKDLAQLPTKIFPPLLGWEGIPCETLKLHNLFIDQKLLEAINTSGSKRLHILDCIAALSPVFGLHGVKNLDFYGMENLEELDISIPDFNSAVVTPASLRNLRAHCPKSTVDSPNERLKPIRLGLYVPDSAPLEHV